MNSFFLAIIASIASTQAGETYLLDSNMRFNQLEGSFKSKTRFTFDANGTEVECINDKFTLDCNNQVSHFKATNYKIFARTPEVLCVFKFFKKTDLKASSALLVDYSPTLLWCLDIKKREFHVKKHVRH
ncbi:hypothetical protein DSO57_1011309 [Entomophthora muscae]|uniref:Uncharacterized protein n=1 Tax=Entomophthora muscae TaxID=34485 RepID=A0ACC2T659_9FUNG|nr:hypothetical protein DSO57_1011309 [Entomophthora muscae]